MRLLLLFIPMIFGGFMAFSQCPLPEIAPWVDDVEAMTASTTFSTQNCWTTTPSTGYDWNIDGLGSTPSLNTGPDNGANSGANYFYVEASSGTTGSIATLESPQVDLAALTVPILQFHYHMYGATIDQLEIQAWDGLAWVTLDQIVGQQQTAGTDPWIQHTVYLGAITGVTQFRFVATRGTSFTGDICLDDIQVVEAPTCPQPSNLTLDNADNTTATFSWFENGTATEWTLEYGPVGFTPGTGTSMLTTNNPETITGLTPDTFYEAYVRAACTPGDTSFYTGPVSFNTYNQPSYMDWEVDCGSGWNEISNLTPNLIGDEQSGLLALPFPILWQGTLVNEVTIDDNGAIQFGNTNTVGFTNQNMSVAPDGLFPFWDDLDAGNIYIGISGGAPNQTLIFQWEDRPHFPGVAGQEVTFQVQIREATGEVYFFYTDKVFGGSQANFDYGLSATVGVAGPNQDLEVSYNDDQFLMDNSCIHFFYTDCPKPTNYQVIYTTNDEAGITWAPGVSGETDWTVIYGPEGFDPTTGGTTINTTSPTATFPGLDDLTTYDVYIYADCNPGVLQSIGAFGQFTTLPNCSDVTGIATGTAVDSVFTSWSWVESSGTGLYPSTGFNLQYGEPGFGLYDGTQTIVNADNNYTDTTEDLSLMGGGVYEIYVQSVCGTDTSNWVGPVTFLMPVTNDSTCNAIDLMVDGTIYNLHNGGASTQANENTIAPPATGCNTTTGWCNSNVNFTSWFTFTAPPSGSVWIDSRDGGFNGQLAVYEATDCANFNTFTLLGANDDAYDFSSPSSPYFSVCGLTPGNTYYLMHDSWSTVTTGTYTISMNEIIVEAGASAGIIDVCSGDVVDLYTGITGYIPGGTWTEEIPTAGFSDPLFPTAGLAYQIFNFEYQVFEGCAYDTIIQQVEVYGPSSAGIDGSIDVCMNEPINLLSGLSGNIDMNGTWYDPANNPLPSGYITASFVPGQFNYDYVADNGVCPTETSNVVVNVLPTCDYLDLLEVYFGSIDLYPNPTSGAIYIDNKGSIEVFNYTISDVNGKEIAMKENAINGTETTEISLEGLEPGIYMIRIHNTEAEKTFRVIKQ